MANLKYLQCDNSVKLSELNYTNIVWEIIFAISNVKHLDSELFVGDNPHSKGTILRLAFKPHIFRTVKKYHHLQKWQFHLLPNVLCATIIHPSRTNFP